MADTVAKPVSENISDNIRQFTNSNVGVAVIIGILFIVLAYVMVYLFRQYNNTSLKTVTMIKKPIRIPSDSFKNISSETGLPSLNYVNGREFSYSFWMYVDGDNDVITNTDKIVLARLDNTNSVIDDASPGFFLDKNTNKLRVKMNGKSGGTSVGKELYIKYLPYQRWINVVLVVDNNFIQLFMDGELKEVKDLSDQQSIGSSTIVDTPVGNLFIGSTNTNPSFNGFISKVQVFNYAVTIDHAKIIYKAGPLHKTVLSNIGLSKYGFQSPIYRIDEQEVKE